MSSSYYRPTGNIVLKNKKNYLAYNAHLKKQYDFIYHYLKILNYK